MKHIRDPFALAFSHLVHKDIAILEVFLALYFRPNNFHCIHLDAKVNSRIRKMVSNLVNCYSKKAQNGAIFLIAENESIDVVWGETTMLTADIKCINELLKYTEDKSTSWRYSLSLAGTELPTKSYRMFHNTISQALGKDDSSVESMLIPFPSNKWHRLTKRQRTMAYNFIPIKNSANNVYLSYNRTKNITFQVFKGMRNVILSVKDAKFIINHPISKLVYDWFQKGSYTEEHFYATMVRFKVDPDTKLISQNTKLKIIRDHEGLNITEGNTLHGLCPRYTNWVYEKCEETCKGQCILSIGNFNRRDRHMRMVENTECLMLNKFNLEVDP